MEITHSGGIVLNPKNEVLLVLNKPGFWTFPRGHVEKDEDLLSAAKREIKEEAGVEELEFIKDLGTYERKRLNEDKMMKSQMYLFKTNQIKVHSNDSQIQEVKWVSKGDVEKTLTAQGDKDFFNSIKSSF